MSKTKQPKKQVTRQASPRQTADDLERIIAHLDTLYEQGDDCLHPDTGIIVTDGEYDALRRQLRQLRPESPVFDTATASRVEIPVAKVVHDPPLTSIEKASHEDIETQEAQLFKWLADCVAGAPANVREGPMEVIAGKTYNGHPVGYPLDYFFLTYKLDGVAIGLYYQDGQLTKAGLRPRDGINGEDVTQQATYVTGIPRQLKLPVSCSIRGELICLLSDFEQVNRELADANVKLRANPRNHTAGGIRQFKDPRKTQLMRLSFIAYGIERLANPPYKTEIERARWCREQLGVPFAHCEPFQFASLAKMEQAVPTLDFEVDGVVVGVNNLEDQEQLGRHGDPRTGNPKGKIAWKFREEEATPEIKEIQWQTGRTGKIVAVAVFDAVRLAGTNVTRATLHNAGFMKRNQITVGSVIGVRKAGKIIPKVTRVVSGQGEPSFPSVCPSCGAATELQAGGTEEMLELVCTSRTCPAQTVSSLCHYLTTFGVLGLGESRVSQLVEGGAVETPADFYRLTVDSAVACGLSPRQSLLALGGIHLIPAPDKMDDAALESAIEAARQQPKSIPLAQLIAALGIDNAGKSAGKALESHFHGFDEVRAASVTDLEAVEDVGTKTAERIHAYLQAHREEIDDLLQFVEPELPTTGKLTGKIFCFSGGFEEGKRHWEQQVEALGGKCTGTVSKKTSFLVAGPGSGSKSEKAKKLGTPIITVEELKRLL